MMAGVSSRKTIELSSYHPHFEENARACNYVDD